MSHQLSFAGFEASPPVRATDRLFYGIFPEAAAAARVARLAPRLRGEHRLQGRPFAVDRFHITLHLIDDYVGDPPQGDIAAALEAAAAIVATPFHVDFDRAMSFKKSRRAPFVLVGSGENVALMAFHQALGVAMIKAGLRPSPTASFKPHVTMLYDDRVVVEQAVEPIGWTVREFVLVRSLLGQTRYILLGRWPLGE